VIPNDYRNVVVASLEIKRASSSCPPAEEKAVHITVSELAAYSGACHDTVTLKLANMSRVTRVSLDMYANDVEFVRVLLSLDGVNWHHAPRDVPKGTAWAIQDAVDYTATAGGGVDARYVRVLLFNTMKVVIRELTVEATVHDVPPTDCANQCSGHGVCDTVSCTCDAGWAGVDCSYGACDTDCGSTGACVNGTCACTAKSGEASLVAGYHGHACIEPLPCPKMCGGQSRGMCSAHPTATTTSPASPPTCVCQGSFFGRDCLCRKNRPLGYGLVKLSDNVTVTTNDARDASDPSKLALLVDGHRGPLWQSGGSCHGRNGGATYVTRAMAKRVFNPLWGACVLGLCTASCECGQSRVIEPEEFSCECSVSPFSPGLLCWSRPCLYRSPFLTSPPPAYLSHH
jgi:hypothetical protein